MAVGQSAQVLDMLGGGSVVYTTHHELDFYEIKFEPVEQAGVVVEQDLTLPADAVLQAAHFAVSAEPVGLAKVSSVATARSTPPQPGAVAGCTIDFGRLVTVSEVSYGDIFLAGLPAINRVWRWTGASWAFAANAGSFSEVGTERLLVESNAAGVDSDELADALATHGAVRLPAVPGQLELQVGGSTVWFERQSSSPIDLPVPQVAPGSAFVIDRTDAAREVFSRAPVTDGTKTVRICLRAATPGRLVLAPSIAALRVHTVAFQPDGVVHAVDVPEEGELGFDVSPPAAADVREVSLTVRGSFGPERVQPAVGPPLVAEARLVLAPSRPVLIGLPDELTSRFGSMTGVRLALRASDGTNGGQVTGRLLADSAGRPGEPLPGGDLAPVTVGPGVERFRTLPFTEAVEPPVVPPPTPPSPATPAAPPPPRVSAWLELQLAHGSVECAFTGNDPNDGDAPGAVVLRRLPGGGTAPLSDIAALGPPLRAAVRIVGLPDRDRPIPAVVLGIVGSADLIGVTPTSDDLAARLTLAAPLPVAGAVILGAVIAGPGNLTLDTVQVTYREVDDG